MGKMAECGSEFKTRILVEKEAIGYWSLAVGYWAIGGGKTGCFREVHPGGGCGLKQGRR
jgi:hypothetical protein